VRQPGERSLPMTMDQYLANPGNDFAGFARYSPTNPHVSVAIGENGAASNRKRDPTKSHPALGLQLNFWEGVA
jgi:hypothetical protein